MVAWAIVHWHSFLPHIHLCQPHSLQLFAFFFGTANLLTLAERAATDDVRALAEGAAAEDVHALAEGWESNCDPAQPFFDVHIQE